MQFIVLRKADVIAGVPSRWNRQYRETRDLDKIEIGKRLAALSPGFTAEQVDSIIGNRSWTMHECSNCGQDRDVLIRLGEEPDYEAKWLDLCADCLAKALEIIKRA